VKVSISGFSELLEKLVQYEKYQPKKEKDIPPPTEQSIMNGKEFIKKDSLSNRELIREDNPPVHKISDTTTNSLPEKRKSISEKEMEDAIVANPEKYLGESGLKLVARQYKIGNYIFDLLFEDRHGAKLIVEIQKGTLDRNHTYKIFDYHDEYKDNNPKEFVELMIIANIIPRERQDRLRSKGIDYREIPINSFLEDLED
jgi:RecB family endonuclease NucS